MYDQVAQNKRRSALLITAFVVLVTAVGAVLNLLLGNGVALVAVALVVAGGSALLSYWKADAIALRMSRARPAPVEEFPRLHNVVDGLCIAAGLPKPRLYVVDDASPNAFATGRNPKHAAIAVTTGLLDRLNRVELEGVLAHELSHIKSYDILVSTLAVTLVGFVPLQPVRAWLVQATVGDRRETLADVSGVDLTRYPPGLISALEKLRDHDTVVRSASPATTHLWIAHPVARPAEAGSTPGSDRTLDPHQPLEERIAVLREL